MSQENGGAPKIPPIKVPTSAPGKATFNRGDVFIIRGLYFQCVGLEMGTQLLVLQCMTPEQVIAHLTNQNKAQGKKIDELGGDHKPSEEAAPVQQEDPKAEGSDNAEKTT